MLYVKFESKFAVSSGNPELSSSYVTRPTGLYFKYKVLVKTGRRLYMVFVIVLLRIYDRVICEDFNKSRLNPSILLFHSEVKTGVFVTGN